jgi:hypothetical protein
MVHLPGHTVKAILQLAREQTWRLRSTQTKFLQWQFTVRNCSKDLGRKKIKLRRKRNHIKSFLSIEFPFLMKLRIYCQWVSPRQPSSVSDLHFGLARERLCPSRYSFTLLLGDPEEGRRLIPWFRLRGRGTSSGSLQSGGLSAVIQLQC